MADPIQLINSRQLLKRVRGGRDGLYPFLENLTLDMVTFRDDFEGDSLNAKFTTVLTTTDGSLAITGAPNLNPGTAKLQASADAEDDAAGAWTVFGNLAYQPTQNPVFSVRLQSHFVDTCKIEIGWNDSITLEAVANVLATPSATATNGAVFVLDLHDAGNPTQWQLFTVADGGTPQKVEPAQTPEVDTYYTFIVALRDASAIFTILDANGGVIYGPTEVADAVDSTVALTPHLSITNRDGTDVNYLLLDLVDLRVRRTVA
jgi:hypothetical protein